MGLTEISTRSIPFNTLVAENSEITEILWGLQQTPKILPPKFFYDTRGSELFDQICGLDAYYLARTETSIMQQSISDIAQMIGPQNILLEFGSGSSLKTQFLLDHLPALETYIPIDISRNHLYQTADCLRQRYPQLLISPLWADFTKTFSLPLPDTDHKKRLAYFPGSTLGNFHPWQALAFLRNVANLVGSGGGLLIGLDLQKDPNVLNLAYNDPQGVTADFNRNILRHINRKFAADFDENQFEHLAFYNPTSNRIEMHLISQREQDVHISGSQIHFNPGENILTEVSYKYTLDNFAQVAQKVGFKVQNIWLDDKHYFSVQFLIAQ